MHDDTRVPVPSVSRGRIGWWILVSVLVAAAAFVVVRFVGLVVLGVFGYYATRPICDRLGSVVDSDRLAAVLTVSVVLVPVLLTLAVLAVRATSRVRQVASGGGLGSFLGRAGILGSLNEAQRQQVRTLLEDPTSVVGGSNGALVSNADLALGVVGAVFGGVVLVALALTLTYVLLARDSAIADAFVELAGGRDTTAYAYAAAVDEDLESVFFGNLLFAALMSVVAAGTYWVTNLFAPDGLAVPLVLVLGLLTGVASLVPVVVGKIVYVPVVALLGAQALRSGTGLAFVATVLVVYVVVLDLVPQSLVQPYVSGRRLDTVLLLFAYLLGPIAFGWYGFFLLPILFVCLLEAVRIVLPDLLRGESPGPTASLDVAMGTDPQRDRDDVPAPGEASSEKGPLDGGSSTGDGSPGETSPEDGSPESESSTGPSDREPDDDGESPSPA